MDEAYLLEFKRIYEAEFQDSMSLEEAREMASRLLMLYELLSRPLPKRGDEVSEA